MLLASTCLLEIIKPLELNSHVIYADLSHLGVITLTGPDASKFLQGQCTIDVQKIADNQAKIAAICNREGRAVILFHLIKQQDSFHLLLPKDILHESLLWLKKYAAFSKVTIQDQTEHYDLQGLFCINGITLKSNQYQINHTLAYQLTEKTTQRNETNHPLSYAAWQALMLLYKHPSLHKEGIGKWLPYELGLLDLDAIDFDKGCYIGQEIIARMHYRSKRRFEIIVAHITCPDSPLYGEIIDHHEKQVGHVIDATRLTHTQHIVLLSIKDGIYAEPLFLLTQDRYHIELIAHGGQTK